MRKKWVTTFVSLCIIALLISTGRDKLMNFPITRLQMSESPWSLVSNNAYFFAWAVPLTEMIICLMLLWLPIRKWGFITSFILFSAFTIYIGVLMVFVPHLPCSCGAIMAELSWWQHLGINIVFLILSFWGVSNEFYYSKREQISKDKFIAHS
ncbi:hypothetical protein SAMN05660909_04485 [Chitinophaga terrae (ex Kim and Jung 2007)]|uniref:Methylamine utilisation protein MauE domain-containing protein n=1 Tax=Chitinophaga terrae (ex Kim and Jung 2007) TaxID=408074 RepID=A0A1H4FM47_9BACT|nr:MauE/DoxX family redox-associated membrane protein [Chitinophaga terrae (ex Kim and Jung 2007)]SEA97900.1 hypothetical protein SAMN05660909_04485 [Chitinophaga terrae (ex Kim and Jung 2007)]